MKWVVDVGVVVINGGGGGKRPDKPVDTADPDQVDEDYIDNKGASGPVDGRVVDLKQDGAEVEGQFYISKSGTMKGGGMYVTLAFGRDERDVALALIDMEARMLHGTFKVKREQRRTSGDDAIRAWYEQHVGK